MKKFWSSIIAILIVGQLFGCSGKNGANGTSIVPTEFNKTGTLQGVIMDATTGQGVGGDVQVRLIQGVLNRTPDKLVTGVSDPLKGEYAFANIPLDLNVGNITYKVVVSKTGYQQFEGDLVFNAIGGPLLLDAVYNKIGNVYIFPTGTSAGDVNVFVKDPQGLVVNGATVLLQQNITANTTTTAGIVDRLLPSAGLTPDLSATTDALGKATFPSSSLVLGGSYTPVVLPITANNQQLGNSTGASFIIGANTVDRQISMSILDPYSLYVVSASNSVPGTITSTGVLTLTFNQPIILSSTTFGQVLSAASGGALAANAVGSLDSTGTVLTITPGITTAPSAKGATITYSYTGWIYLKNSQTFGVSLFTGLASDPKTITSNLVSGIVQLTSY